MTSPIRFGTALQRAIRDAGMTNQQAAAEADLSESHLSHIINGHSIPMHGTAVALADVLMAPLLITLSLRTHTRACDICGMAFVDGSRQALRRYCSRTCKLVARKRRQREVSHQTVAVSKHRLRVFQDAIVAMCRGCSPEGMCPDSTCALREVSPFPLEPRRAARVA